jgi:hypothetical protein
MICNTSDFSKMIDNGFALFIFLIPIIMDPGVQHLIRRFAIE